MAYRTVEILWRPRSSAAWSTFTAARAEAARLCGDLVEIHFRIRRSGKKWPTIGRWQKWAKGKYPGLSAQSVQQIIGEFCEAVASTKALRKNGHEAKYPWKKSKFRDITYTNQDARVRNGFLILPNGKSGALRVKMPEAISLPGRLMEVRLSFGCVRLVCEIAEKAKSDEPKMIGVDLGVNTLIAATDGRKAVLVNGRGIKATVQWRNKSLSEIQEAQAKRTKGGHRWRRLQRRKRRMLDKANRRMRDACHKATRKIADAFPDAKAYVGEAFNDAAIKMGRKTAQTVSQACCGRITHMLDYKMAGAIVVNEAWSSQTCPVCGERAKCNRIFRCRKCGYTAPRDVVGCTNILRTGRDGGMKPGRRVPNSIEWILPVQVSRACPGSSGGHPASSSGNREAPQF